MDKKSKVIFLISIIFVTVIGVGYFFLLKSFDDKKNNQINTKEELEDKISKITEEEKIILNIEDDDEEDNITEEFKEYLKLPDEEKKKIQVVPEEKEKIPDDLENIKEKIDYEEKEKIPERFNLADILDIKVENQGSFGLCWAFASTKTLETYMQLHNEGVHNFSEIHIDYMTASENTGLTGREVHTGGNFSMFEEYLLLYGVVEEEPNEYHDYSKKEYSKFIEKEPVTIVTETISFPSLNKKQATDEDIKEFRDTIKTHIMKNGALYTVIASPYFTQKNLYSSEGINIFTDSGHAVAIVGWDDNYSKNNFYDEKKSKVPEHDGAYIAVNSWGKEFGDNGYFYISYDDAMVEGSLNGIVSTSLDNAYKVNEFKTPEIKDKIEQELSYTFINYNGEDYVSNLALNKANSLKIKNRKLTSDDINNIKKLKKLTSITLENNELEDISFLTELKKLYHISLNDNLVKNVSSLSELPKLTNLYLNNNKDVTGYENLVNLSTLSLSGCNISNLDFINSFNKLYELNLSNNNISNLEGLNLEKFEYLNINLSNNRIITLPNWTNLNIETINLSNNNLESLNGLPNNLYSLDISGNKNIKDFSYIKNGNLNNLLLKDCNITSIDFLGTFKYGTIDLSDNNISDISLFNSYDITSLILKNNNISDLINFNNDKIKYLNLSKNKNLKNLKTLNSVNNLILSDCNITNLDEIKYLDKVNSLDLSYNDIKDISDLGKLTSLTTLSLAHNKNLTGKVIYSPVNNINLEDCNIISFDISGFNNLYYINLSNNLLFDYKSFFENLKNGGSISINFNNFDVDSDILKIIQSKKNISVSGINLIYDFSENDDYEIQPTDYLLLNNILRYYNSIKIINGKYVTRANRIDVIDFNKDLEIHNISYNNSSNTNYYYLSDIKLKYRFKKAI